MQIQELQLKLDISAGVILIEYNQCLIQKCLKMADTVFHHDKFEQCKLKDEIKFCKNKHTKNCKRFRFEIFCRFKSTRAYLLLDHYRQGNKKITNDIKENVKNLENATKEGIHQLKANVQHLSENMLTQETKLAHPKEGGLKNMSFYINI